MQDKKKPDSYVIARLVEQTGKSADECAEVYIAHDYLYKPALNALLESEHAHFEREPEPPATVYVPLVLTDGTQLHEGMRPEEIVPDRPKAGKNTTKDRAIRVCDRIAQKIKERGDNMDRVPVKDLKAGEIVYENGYGLSRQVRILTTPARVDSEFEKGWRCLAQDVHKKFEFFEHDDYPCYAPNITRSATYSAIELLPQV